MAQLTIRAPDGTLQTVSITKDCITIGRSHDNDVFLPDQLLSRHHAEILKADSGYTLKDLGSKNGTLLNGARVNASMPLAPGDSIVLGDYRLTFVRWSEPADDPLSEDSGAQVFKARDISDVFTRTSDDEQGLERQNRILTLLTRAAQDLVLHRPLNELFELVLDLLFQAVPAERGAVLIIEAGAPVVRASRSRQGEEIKSVSRSITRAVLNERVTLLLPHVDENESFNTQESIIATGIRSAVCAPLWFRHPTTSKEEVIGLVYLDSRSTKNPFAEDDLRIITALANLAAARIENVRLVEESLEKQKLEQDLAKAAQIQAGLLPSVPPVVAGYTLSGSNEPCRAVGGDYYDFELEDGRLLVALGDVAGKGTAAALLMMVLRVSLRGHWGEASLEEATKKINKTMCQNVTEGKYVTCFIANMDPETGHVEYVNAGHNPPLVIRVDGSVERLTEGGTPLGLFDGCEYDSGSVELTLGDTLLIFSDGVSETWNEDEEDFGDERLVNLVADRPEANAKELEIEILAALARYSGGAKALDDRTLVVLKRTA